MARVGAFVWEPSGVMTWSDQLFRLLDAAPGSLAPSHHTLLDHVHPDDQARLQDTLFDALGHDPIGHTEARALVAGQLRQWLFRTEVVRSTEGSVRHALCTIVELPRVGDKETAERLAHELSNQLTVVLTNATALLTDVGPSPALTDIVDAGHRATEVLHRLRVFATGFPSHAVPVDDPRAWPQLRGRRALVVEDDERVRAATVRLLQRAGMLVAHYPGPEEAAAVTDEAHDVVVCDVEMPCGGGRRVLEERRARWPDERFVFVTGDRHPPRWLDEHVMLAKPFAPGLLLQALAEAVGSISAGS